MSEDDFFVLCRLLPTTGQLVHYLEVRQQVAGIPNALLFDEIDHLGAYISRNRFDQDIREQLKEADRVTWDSFSDVVEKHFEGIDWETRPVPTQSFPEPLERMFRALDRVRPAVWLLLDGFLRDFDGDGRNNIARFMSELEPTLAEHPRRRFQLGEDAPIQIWLCREGAFPGTKEIQYQAEVGCLVVGASKMQVLMLGYEAVAQIGALACASFPAPSILRTDYGGLQAEAQRQRGRMRKLPRAKAGKGRKKRK
jgi:hypothetical protein